MSKALCRKCQVPLTILQDCAICPICGCPRINEAGNHVHMKFCDNCICMTPHNGADSCLGCNGKNSIGV